MNEFSLIQGLSLTMILAMNFLSVGLFFIDKRKAKAKAYRISEKHLLLASFLFGGVGAFVGMKKFRHKTKKTKFKVGVPIAAVWTILVCVAVIMYL